MKKYLIVLFAILCSAVFFISVKPKEYKLFKIDQLTAEAKAEGWTYYEQLGKIDPLDDWSSWEMFYLINRNDAKSLTYAWREGNIEMKREYPKDDREYKTIHFSNGRGQSFIVVYRK